VRIARDGTGTDKSVQFRLSVPVRFDSLPECLCFLDGTGTDKSVDLRLSVPVRFDSLPECLFFLDGTDNSVQY